jgi:hypothetical protein
VNFILLYLSGTASYNKVWENSMPELPEVIKGAETKIYFHGTICQMCLLAVPLTIKVGLTMVGNHAKPSILKKLYSLQFEQMVQRTASDLNTKLTSIKQRL